MHVHPGRHGPYPGLLDTWAELSAVRTSRAGTRFASPTRLGADLTVRAYDAGDGVVAFDAACGDATVITHGRLELRP